jgi:hypothetical protein
MRLSFVLKYILKLLGRFSKDSNFEILFYCDSKNRVHLSTRKALVFKINLASILIFRIEKIFEWKFVIKTNQKQLANLIETSKRIFQQLLILFQDLSLKPQK